MRKIKIKAQIKAPDKKPGFWKAVWLIIGNKKQTDGSLTAELFGGIISAFFNIMAILGVVVSVIGLIGIILTAISMEWSAKNAFAYIFAILIAIAIIVTILVLSLIFRAAANEMQTEKDRNYIVSVFSGIVSFAALIVALVALLKGVG